MSSSGLTVRLLRSYRNSLMDTDSLDDVAALVTEVSRGVDVSLDRPVRCYTERFGRRHLRLEEEADDPASVVGVVTGRSSEVRWVRSSVSAVRGVDRPEYGDADTVVRLSSRDDCAPSKPDRPTCRS